MKKYYILFFVFASGLINAFSQSKPLDISNVLLNFSNYQPISEKNGINGYAGLDSNSLILGDNLFEERDMSPLNTPPSNEKVPPESIFQENELYEFVAAAPTTLDGAK